MSEPLFFHEISDEKWEEIKAAGATWEDVAKKYLAPKWCGYGISAVDALGCWSLVGRKVTGEDFCKSCDAYSEVQP